MPRLENRTGRSITIMAGSKKTIIPPNTWIEGPVQLTIYGLTAVPNHYMSTVVPQTSNEFMVNNGVSIDNAVSFIKKYNKNSKPTVGVCILTKDSFKLITECIESIEAKVNYENTEIYIFDTGTTDQGVLDFYKLKTEKCKFPFKVIDVGKYHFSTNYNIGLRQVNTDFFVLQNNDTLAINDYISKLVKIAILDKIGVVGPRMLYQDGRIQHDGQIIYNHLKKGFGHPGHVNLGASNLPGGRFVVDGITGAGIFVRREHYWSTGGFNEKYKDIYQDVEFNIRSKMSGKLTVCDRDALINHYDNTSRKNLWNDPIKLRAMHEDEAYMFSMYGNSLKYNERQRYKFSIVTLVNNEETYINFLNDLKKSKCNFLFEVIAIPNFNKEYTGVSEALNIGLDVSESDFTILCHQDLRVSENWFSIVNDHVKELIGSNVNFGVLGIAGGLFTRETNGGEYGAVYLDGKDFNDSFGTFGRRVEVQTLDELCLIVKTSNPIRFDENTFSHYHFYGADFCLTYLFGGYKNYAIAASLTHLSDGISNLVKQSESDRFVEDAIKLFKKWKPHYPYFKTTTAKFFSGRNAIKFFIAKALIDKGITIKEDLFLK